MIIRYRSPEGRNRICDSRCHNAVGPECRCLCKGFYHSAKRNGNLNELVLEHQHEIIKTLEEEGGKLLTAVILMNLKLPPTMNCSKHGTVKTREVEGILVCSKCGYPEIKIRM